MRNDVLLAAALAISASSHLAASDGREASVIIRAFNYAQVPGDRMAVARASADRIFRVAGISLQWVECSVPPDDTGSACTEPLHDGRDFVLRLTDGSSGDVNRRKALGAAVIDRETRGGVLMTVAPRLVWAVAESTATNPAMLLGRTIAHELGHLLLGEAEHPRVGVMRAFWSRDELRGIRPADWRFSPREAAQMRQAILARTRPAD